MSDGAPTEAFGPYLVYEELGMGGMAQVHRAEIAGREGFQRPVALKRMLPHVASNADMVKAFVREAHLASHLRHANVAQTYELGKVDGIYFIAMELIAGRNLREILKQCALTTGPMPVPVALNILNQLCDALDYAHNLCDEGGTPLGIIHRDVSPSNVIVAEGGVVKLIDFGIAKASASGMQTMSGTIKGKFGYMAPEYIAGSIDARADLFALGVIAHELLTNKPLFSTADDLETLERVRKMEVLPPSHKNPLIPCEVDDIVMTALSRDPSRRWQHATALKNALTTQTHRLGLAISNQTTVQWLDWAFDQTNRSNAAVPDPAQHTISIESSDPNVLEEASIEPSISIERGTAVMPDPQVRVPVAATGRMTLMMNGPAPGPPSGAMAMGTPPKMTAQRSLPPSAPEHLGESGMYHAAVVAFERHEALAPGTRVSQELLPSPMPHASLDSLDRLVTSPVVAQQMTLPGTAIPPRHHAAQGSMPPPARYTPPSVPPPVRSPEPIPPTQHDGPDRASKLDRGVDREPAFVHSNPRIALPPAPTAEPAPKGSGLASTVILVLLAAAIAGIAVYFVLPLL